jgi:molybdenum cofactor biosynthesis enzyme MoaA
MLNCKFITNGISIQQDQVLRPCCSWEFDQDWAKNNNIKTVEIANWHRSKDVLEIKEQLDRNEWPKQCVNCSWREQAGDYNNMRSNGNSAYSHYDDSDITLEIRPGNVCNFACQTCWPEASSRVANFQYRAGIIDKRPTDELIDDFDFLKPVSHRIRDVVLLGGEPFYDKNCRKFLDWSREHLTATQMIFTNGLFVDYDFLDNYKGKIILIFSLDAMGSAAEYIRFGTIWDQVWENYKKCRSRKNIEIRVNVTTSVYNYIYIKPLFDLLSTDWPDLITFGSVNESHLQAKNIPTETRQPIIDSLVTIAPLIQQLDIVEHQKQHVVNYVQVMIDNLTNLEFDHKSYQYLTKYIESLDRVKNIQIKEYCPEVAEYLLLK